MSNTRAKKQKDKTYGIIEWESSRCSKELLWCLIQIVDSRLKGDFVRNLCQICYDDILTDMEFNETKMWNRKVVEGKWFHFFVLGSTFTFLSAEKGSNLV